MIKYPHRFAIIVMLFACVFQLHYFIDGTLIPGGDGKRVLPFVEFHHAAQSWYPQWNPFKAGGVPVIADPERYVGLSLLLPSLLPDSAAVLMYNLLYILGTAWLLISFYGFLRSIALSAQASLLGSLLLLGSQYLFNILKSGRIDVLYAHVAIFFTLVFIARWCRRQKRLDLTAAALGTGLIFISQGYYALVTLYPLVLTLLLGSFQSTRLVKNVFGVCAFTGLVGAGIAAAWLLPVFDYMMHGHHFVVPVSTLADDQPALTSLINMITPLSIDFASQKTLKSFFFISPLVLPLLFAYVLGRRKALWPYDKGPWPYEKPFFGLLLFALFFMLGELPPVGWLLDALAEHKVFALIRWNLPFQFLLLVGVIVFSALGFDALATKAGPGKTALSALAILIVLALSPLYLADTLPFVLGGFSAAAKFALSAGLAVLLFYLVKAGQYRWQLVAMVLLIQYGGFKSYQDFHHVLPESYSAAYRQVLGNDSGYFRVHLRHGRLGLPELRNFSGFSMYFSNEHRLAMQSLYHLPDITVSRPHWIRPPKLAQWHQPTLEMLNIKYVEVHQSRFRGALKEHWQLRARHGKKLLLARKDWSSALRFFNHWSVVTSAEEGMEKLRRQGFAARLFVENRDLEQAAGHNAGHNAGHDEAVVQRLGENHYRVNTQQAGFLFIPEYYDRYWSLEVNGQPQPLVRANGCCQAVYLRPGEHVIRLSYQPRSFYWGMAVTLGSLLLLLLTALSGLRQTHRPPGPSANG